MPDTQVVSIAREASTAFFINAALSIAFFLGMFRTRATLAWGAPDGLAIDFVPQSIAVCLMSALVPVLIARRRVMNAGIVDVIGVRKVVLLALCLALAGGALGGLLAWMMLSLGLSPITWHTALAGKAIYGGLLGAVITKWALRRLVR
ncbi:hypothetical protein PX699_18970 [Sphingobium sp. H39-3-25]|uniref:hypothetical protein n=1 Tax=Sphingobium arseniciresistens TaxID=3030834 RepID=UPI0023B9A325|nr:hypothetical protein [Sphingobium arseniciresistens]